MMDFLRRLAPPLDGERGRAMPVVASPMEMLAPLRATPALSQRDDAARIVRWSDGPAPTVFAGERVRAVRPVEVERTPRTEPVAIPPARRADAVAGTPPDRAARRESSTRASTAAPMRAVVQQPECSPAAGPAPVVVDVGARFPAPERELDCPASRSPHGRATVAEVRERVAPLSASAVAARTVPPTTAPTVVHVTIDRIDLRGPAAPPSAAPRKPERARTPSLVDYLRGRGDAEGAMR